MSFNPTRSLLQSTVIVAGRSPVVVILGAGLMISLASYSQRILDLPWQERALDLSLICFAVLVLFEAVRRLSTRAAPLPVRSFLAISLGLGLALRLIYVWHIQPEWYSDFLRYWDYGVDLASGRRTEVGNIYAKRANLLTRPLIEVFGPNKLVVPLWNAASLTLIQGLGYDILRRIRSHQAAQGFSLLWMATPLPMMAMAVPSHDVAGIFLIGLAVWLMVVAQFRPASSPNPKWGSVICWAAAGLVLSLLETVRGLGAISLACLVVMTLALLVVTAWKSLSARHMLDRNVLRAATGLVVICMSFLASEHMLRRVGAVPPAATEHYATLRYTTPQATSMSDGSYSFLFAFGKAFTQDLRDEPESFSAFRRSLVLTDFAEEPTDRLQASLARMQGQYSLGAQQGYYLRGIPDNTVVALTAFSLFFGVAFSGLLLLAIYRLIHYRSGQPTVDHFLLLLTAIISMALLLVGANQPRYIFVLWLAGALVIPSQLSFRDCPGQNFLSPARLIASSAGALICMLTALWLITILTFTPARGLILHNWIFSTDAPDSEVRFGFFPELQSRESTVMIDRDGKSVPVRFDELSLKLMLPTPPAYSARSSATQKVCGLPPAASLEFQYDAPAKHLQGKDAFSLALSVNGRKIWRAALPNPQGPERVRTGIPVDSGGCAEIRFDLLSHGKASRSSWQRASFVEVFFPRIIEPQLKPARSS